MIGIIPAAGQARRMNGIPKMLLPSPRGPVLIDVLRDRLYAAGANAIYVGINEQNCEMLRLTNCLFYPVRTNTMSETVLAAKRYAGNERVLFGMPDSYWSDDTVYPRLTAALDDGAMVAAALFYTRKEQRNKLGMCDVREEDDSWRVARVFDKPIHTSLTLAWGALAWTPAFWAYIAPEDPHVGYALARAASSGVAIPGVLAVGTYFDCGTPAEYLACIRTTTPEANHASA